IGLALSSGGSKTAAHLGVIAALRAGGVEIDAVAGASGGAVAAITVAFDKDESQQRRYLDDIARATHWRRLDVNFPPRSGVWKGQRLRDMFAQWDVGPNLEDAAIPVWLVGSDVATGATVTMQEGSVADAIRASMSIPGALDPWRVGDRVLIDGAVANPLPTDVLRDAGVGVVIASNVAGQSTEFAVNGKLPGLNQIMSRVLNTMERERLRALLPLADVVIRPRVTASNSFDFSNNETFIEAGATAARARLDDIRTLVDAASQ
ncbi:MAG TPA: patatin-like phospholipase family protein, partial [Acidimicrobiales bacterium]|nr:patatin-like phospholipase family protein [Acidimicrobiales bacterium]